jgi:hypothetical protein
MPLSHLAPQCLSFPLGLRILLPLGLSSPDIMMKDITAQLLFGVVLPHNVLVQMLLQGSGPYD